MDEIKDLIKIVTDHTKRNVPLLDLKNQHSNGNKEMNLFLGLKNGEFQNDLEASNGVYGSDEVDFKFRMLKSRLSRKLLNHLFFMDFESKGYSKTQNYYQEALDYLHFSRMLLNVDEVCLGTKMLQKTVDLAKQCEYTSIVLDCLKALREVYATTYRPKLFRNINNRISELETTLQIEEKADAIFQENALTINSTVNNRKTSVEPYKIAVVNLEELYNQTASYNIFERYMTLNIWCLELEGDFEGVLNFIADIEKKHKAGSVNQERFDPSMFHIAKGNALIKMRKFDEGQAYIGGLLKDVDQSNKMWVSLAEQLVILNLQSGQFRMASEVFLKALNHRFFIELKEKETLRWNIFRSYIYLQTKDKRVLKRFNFQNFIEDTPRFEKGKAGHNVAILILQFSAHLYFNIELLHSIIEAMDDYVAKHLNNSFSNRTKTFCKLLRKVVVYNREYDTIVSKCKYLQEKLYASRSAGNSFIDIEIFPYEMLWENILSRLAGTTNSHFQKSRSMSDGILVKNGN